MNITDAQRIEQTKQWIMDVVVGLNFCPFARREMLRKTVHYLVVHTSDIAEIQDILQQEYIRLDENPQIATTFVIFAQGLDDFKTYWSLVRRCDKQIRTLKYEGVYQLASFHPQYIFAGSAVDDAANYTNRSPYPMLHLLREDSLTEAVDNYPDPENIPNRNIALARSKGLAYMQALLEKTLQIPK